MLGLLERAGSKIPAQLPLASGAAEQPNPKRGMTVKGQKHIQVP